MTEPVRPRAFAVRIAVFYGALFVVYGMHVPYMPAWLDWRGLSPGEISVVLAAPFFLRLFVTPVVALVADRAGKRIARWSSSCRGSASRSASRSVNSRRSGRSCCFAVLLIVANSTIMPLTETIAAFAVRSAGADYGRMRLWGSLTFVAASFAGGLAVAHFGGGAGVWLVAFGCALTVIAAHALPRPDPAFRSLPSAPSDPLWRASEPGALLREPAFRAFLLAGGLTMAAHATFLGFSTLIWQAQGLSGAWIGALWAIGVFVEVAVFAVGGALISRFGPVRLLILAAAASVFRWAAMALQPGLAPLILLQALHGATYGAAHIGAIHFIHAAAPRRAAGTGQALYATVAAGLAMGAATLIAGSLYRADGAAAYAGMAVIACAALAAALRLKRLWSGGLILPETPDEPELAIDPDAALAPEPRIGV